MGGSNRNVFIEIEDEPGLRSSLFLPEIRCATMQKQGDTETYEGQTTLNVMERTGKVKYFLYKSLGE